METESQRLKCLNPEVTHFMVPHLDQGGLQKSPWQAATSQHQLYIMKGEYKSLSQPLLLTHKVSVKMK